MTSKISKKVSIKEGAFFHSRLTIKNAFANDGLFSVIRDPFELLEIHITATLKFTVPEIVIPTEAEDSDHDEELTFADLTAGDSGSDSDSD